MLKLKYNPYLGGLFLFLAYFSIFSKPLAGLLRLSAVSYLDEVILVLGFILLVVVILVSSRVKKVYLLALGFFIYSIIVSLLYGLNRHFATVVLQSLINIKFLVLLLSFFWIFQSRFEHLERFFNNVVIVAVAGLVLNVAFGSGFNHFFDMPLYRRPTVPIRYGGFMNPNHMAFLMALFVGMRLNKARKEERDLKGLDWVYILGSLLAIFLTDSRSALFGVAIFFVSFYWAFMLKNARIFLGFALAMVLSIAMLLVFSNLISSIFINLQGSFSLDSYYIRGIMINMAVQITYLYFPIGTGAATFGSVLSAGSPVYEYFGVANRVFFIEQRGVYDSSVASVMGEYGFLGLLFYGMIFHSLRHFLLVFNGQKSNRMLTGLFWAFFFYSVTNPTLTNNIYILVSIPVFVSFARGQAHVNAVIDGMKSTQ